MNIDKSRWINPNGPAVYTQTGWQRIYDKPAKKLYAVDLFGYLVIVCFVIGLLIKLF